LAFKDIYTDIYKVKLNEKFTLEQTTKARRGLEVKLFSFFNLGNKM